MENEEMYSYPQLQQPKQQTRIPVFQAVFAWGAFALSFIFTHYCVRYFGGIWGGIFWAIFGIFIPIYARKNNVKFKASHIIMLSAAELFCLTPLFSANRFLCFLAAVYSFALYFYLITTLSGAEAFGKFFIADFFRSILIRPFSGFSRQPVFAFSIFKGKSRSKNVLYAFLGLLLALPLTLVVVWLLMSSDDTFKNVMSGFSEFMPRLSFSIFWELLFAVPIAMYLFGALCSVKEPAREYSLTKADSSPEYRFLPPVISYFAVTPICVFYFIYIIVQIKNIADAFGKNIGYADFARNGFFELCAIAVINLGVITIMQTFTKRNEYDKKPLALRVYCVIIPVFTLMIIATAMTKMFMYIGRYGMTMLRMYTSWFMILLALIFIPIIVLQIKDFPIWKTLFAVFSVMFAVLCFGNFEGNIAVYNINAYQSGMIEKIDVAEFEELGIAAVAPAYELYRECEDEQLADLLSAFIHGRLWDDKEQSGFAYFSIPRAMAQKVFPKYDENEAVMRMSEVMRIVVSSETETAYKAGLEYFLDEAPIGGMEIQHSNSRLIVRGEQLTFTFSSRDIPNIDELSDKMFGVRFVITDKNGIEYTPKIPENWSDYLNRNSEIHCRPSNFNTDKPEWVWHAERDGVYEFVLSETDNGGYIIYPFE